MEAVTSHGILLKWLSRFSEIRSMPDGAQVGRLTPVDLGQTGCSPIKLTLDHFRSQLSRVKRRGAGHAYFYY